MKKPKGYVLWLLVLSLFSGLFSCNQESGSVLEKPNVIFILADDMGYGDLGCYNNHSKIPTPHIDKLAAQGIRFTDAHAPGAWCSPSRYGLVTGRYPGLVGMNTRQQSIIDPGQETLATMMKRNGYRTACVGKWHLGFDGVDWQNPGEISQMKGGPVDKGFDYFFGMHASLDIPPYFYIENERAVAPPTAYIDDHSSPDATSKVSGAFFRAGAISPDFRHEEVLDMFLDKAQDFLSDHHTNHANKPFFLYFPLTAPHTPWMPKDKFKGKSGAGEYGDFVMQVDEVVGQLTGYLKRNDLLENTIIFFSSDNGPVWFREDVAKFDHASVGPLRGIKSDMWEGGSRVPFIVSNPARYPTGIESDQMICFTDMMATLAQLVGENALNASDFHSHSFLPVLQNPQDGTSDRTDLVIQQKVYRKGNWKYIDGSGQGGIEVKYAPDKSHIHSEEIPGELYDLGKDLSEQNNLYEEYPDKVKEMKDRLHDILSLE